MLTVETARLRLRPFTEADLPAYTAIRAKPHVVRYLPGGAARAAEASAAAARTLAMFRDSTARDGFGPWAVEEKATARFLGHLGLRRVPEMGGVNELLYLLDDSAWGRGYATEGARAALDYGFGTLGLDRVVAWALEENTASLAVMARLGLRRAPEPVEVFGLMAVETAITREDWARNGSD